MLSVKVASLVSLEIAAVVGVGVVGGALGAHVSPTLVGAAVTGAAVTGAAVGGVVVQHRD